MSDEQCCVVPPHALLERCLRTVNQAALACMSPLYEGLRRGREREAEESEHVPLKGRMMDEARRRTGWMVRSSSVMVAGWL